MNNESRLELLLTFEETIRVLQRILRKATAEKGLTAPQFGFLRLLQEHQASRISELAAKTGVGASSISGTIARLEKLDLIIRNRSSHDRRVVDVHITKKGEELISEVLEARIRALEKVYEHLDETEFSLLVKNMQGNMQENGE